MIDTMIKFNGDSLQTIDYVLAESQLWHDVAAVIAATREARSCPPGAVVGACACDDAPCSLSKGKSFLNVSLAHWRAFVGAGAENDASVT